MKKWRILAHHKWVTGCTITESENIQNSNKDICIRRFTATIRDWQNWLIYEGDVKLINTQQIIDRVKEIKNRIDREDKKVFIEDMTIK